MQIGIYTSYSSKSTNKIPVEDNIDERIQALRKFLKVPEEGAMPLYIWDYCLFEVIFTKRFFLVLHPEEAEAQAKSDLQTANHCMKANHEYVDSYLFEMIRQNKTITRGDILNKIDGEEHKIFHNKKKFFIYERS